jgi:hypothetical protein
VLLVLKASRDLLGLKVNRVFKVLQDLLALKVLLA